MKDLQTYFNKCNSDDIEWKESSNTNYIKLKQDMEKMEQKLQRDMKQQHMEMIKIDKLFKSMFNSANSNCARIVENDNIFTQRTNNKHCMRWMESNVNNNMNNTSGTWNNFNKMEYYARKNNFHGKFLLLSNDDNIFNKTSLSNFCQKFGLNGDFLSIETLENNDYKRPTFLIQITNVFWRMKFLKIIKLNNYLSVTLFSHCHHKNSRYHNHHSNTNGVNKWFIRRWRITQNVLLK